MKAHSFTRFSALGLLLGALMLDSEDDCALEGWHRQEGLAKLMAAETHRPDEGQGQLRSQRKLRS